MNKRINIVRRKFTFSSIAVWTTPIIGITTLPSHAQTSVASPPMTDPVISMPIFNFSPGDAIRIDDDNGNSVIRVFVISSINIDPQASFSLIVSGLTLNSGVGFTFFDSVLSFQGDVSTPQIVRVTITVVNPDGGTDAMILSVDISNIGSASPVPII